MAGTLSPPRPLSVKRSPAKRKVAGTDESEVTFNDVASLLLRPALPARAGQRPAVEMSRPRTSEVVAPSSGAALSTQNTRPPRTSGGLSGGLSSGLGSRPGSEFGVGFETSGLLQQGLRTLRTGATPSTPHQPRPTEGVTVGQTVGRQLFAQSRPSSFLSLEEFAELQRFESKAKRAARSP